MADTKAGTDLTAVAVLSKLESLSRGRRSWLEDIQEARDLLAKYIAQQNRAYVKRLCDAARDKAKVSVQDTEGSVNYWGGYEACADYIEREGSKP